MRWIITCLVVMDPLEPSVDCWGLRAIAALAMQDRRRHLIESRDGYLGSQTRNYYQRSKIMVDISSKTERMLLE